MRKLIYLIISGLSTIGIQAQMGADPNPVTASLDMFPKTPEAAALSKFVDIPAGNYTGVADFSIPLYTIEFDGEKIPIELRYTTTGVTVGQIATRVGLGWILNTGPSLSQQVIGTQDRTFPRPVITSTFSNPNNHGGNVNDPSLKIALAALGYDGNGPRDVQPDIFTYNLLNGSGKFIFNPEGTSGIPMPYNQTKIIGEYGNPNKIIDEKGFQYTFFNQIPSGKTRNTCVEANPEFDYDDPNLKINKIKSPKNQDVTYVYANTGGAKYISSIMTQERVSISVPSIPPGPPIWQSYPNKCINYTYSNDYPLTEIQFKGGKVIFTYNDKASNPRLDLIGDVYLTNVTVKNDKGQIIKDFTLTYDYFSSLSSTLPSELTSSLLSTYVGGLNKRLKLISVKDNLTDGIYNLEYYESYTDPLTNITKKLPIRVSNDQDFWGVYNGKENGQKSISISRYDDVNIQSNYIGADKEPDVNYGRIGNLKKIIYPTGGYSEIQYEADEYDISDNPVIIYNYEETYPHYEANDNTYPTTKIPFTITNNSTYKTLSFTGNPNASSTNIFGRCNWNLKKPNGTTESGQLSNTFTRNDPPGNYELWITRDDNYPNVKCHAEYEFVDVVKTPINTLYTQTAGTIRVSKIESVDNNNGKIVREYSYKTPYTSDNNPIPYTKTSGVNQGEEMFLSRSTNKYPLSNQGHYAVEVLVSNNPGWQTSTLRGKPVGYNYVQEHYVDYNTPANSYRKEYKFKNERIIQYHDPNTPLNINWPVGGLDRGFPEEESLFDSSNHLVKKTVNEYLYDGHFNSKYAPNSNNFGPEGMGSGLAIIPTQKYGSTTGTVFEYTTYTLTNSWIPQKKLTVTDYFNNGNDSIKIVNTNNYSIPAYKHTYPIESIIDGTDNVLKTTLKYPQDITAPEIGSHQSQNVLDDMIAQNYLSTPVLVKNYKNNIVNSEVKTFYEQYNTAVFNVKMFLPKYIYMKKGENAAVEDRKVTFDSYDDQGNLTYYFLENGMPVSIIWGYNKTKPIAKIEGAQPSDIPTYLKDNIENMSNADNNYSASISADETEQNLINMLDTFRKNLPNYQITTYTYDPLIGVRSVTPPSGLTEYYTYDDAGRLKEVKRAEKDLSGNEVLRVLKKNEYHYQQP